jgi:hypothetical protein
VSSKDPKMNIFHKKESKCKKNMVKNEAFESA